MSIPISSIGSVAGVSGLDSLSTKSTKTAGDFGTALKSAVEQVNSYQQDADQAVQQFLQGNGELHNVALATQRAEMTFDLGMQVRNKIVSAYQEVMKMQL